MQDPIYFLNIEYLFQVIYLLLTGEKNYEVVLPFWQTYSMIAYLASALFFIGAIYAYIRLKQIRDQEKEILEILTEEALAKRAEPKHDRWNQVMDHIGSINENDWKLAIIEADSILDEMMKKMGYTQPSLGEKLKSVEKSDFTSIEKAWEAHKVRNAIAHEGSGFLLSQQEAQRVINLYKDVFQEFEYI